MKGNIQLYAHVQHFVQAQHCHIKDKISEKIF